MTTADDLFKTWTETARVYYLSGHPSKLDERAHDEACLALLRTVECPVCGSTENECPIGSGRRRATITRCFYIGGTSIIPRVHLARKRAANQLMKELRKTPDAHRHQFPWTNMKVFP